MTNGGAEDYLKAVYLLRATPSPPTVGRVAQRVGVAAASASTMLRKLQTQGLLARGEDGTIELTPAGEREALRIVRRHRLVETFLHQVLGMGWDEVHDEAEVLEHVVSDRLEASLADYLGHPTHDPHGDPIPRADRPHDESPVANGPLLSSPVGHAVVVRRVLDQRPEVLRHLAALGVVPSARLVLDGVDPFGGPVWLTLADGQVVALGRELAATVQVSVEERRGVA